MEMTDHPRLADCPQSFRVACARLMLVWFWASWPEERLATVGADHFDEDEQRKQDGRDGYGVGMIAHRDTCAVSKPMRSSC